MADDIEFVDGLIVKAPNPKAPSFVKASISIKVADLSDWLVKHDDQEWINIDVKAAKSGKWYASVNTFKPEKKEEKRPAAKDSDEDIPF